MFPSEMNYKVPQSKNKILSYGLFLDILLHYWSRAQAFSAIETPSLPASLKFYLIYFCPLVLHCFNVDVSI